MACVVKDLSQRNEDPSLDLYVKTRSEGTYLEFEHWGLGGGVSAEMGGSLGSLSRKN
jgi:hypothetical protein